MTNRTKVYAVIAGVFLLGAVSGAGVSWAVSQRQCQKLVSGEEGYESRRVGALARELDLNADQKQKIAEIFKRHRDERRELTKTLVERCGDPFRERREKFHAEIAALLNAEQRARFEALIREHDGRLPDARDTGNR